MNDTRTMNGRRKGAAANSRRCSPLRPLMFTLPRREDWPSKGRGEKTLPICVSDLVVRMILGRTVPQASQWWRDRSRSTVLYRSGFERAIDRGDASI